MIVFKRFEVRSQGGLKSQRYEYEGWYLFGWIPLYVRQIP